jgi:cyclopropane fatty-acyl-phospholipid synthase-like methyltransferase
MQNIYENGTYLLNNPSWHEEDSEWKAKQIIKLLIKNKLNPSTICEVGCGSGEILNYLRNELEGDRKFTGYEISPQAFEICKKKRQSNLEFYLGDLLQEQEKFFDLVMAIDVFEHVEDYIGFLRILKQKGEYKVFHIPLDISVLTILRNTPLRKLRTIVGHIHYFTKDTAIATLNDAGYVVIDYFYTKGTLELPKRGWKTKLANIPRSFFFAFNQDFTVRVFGGYSLLVLTK